MSTDSFSRRFFLMVLVVAALVFCSLASADELDDAAVNGNLLKVQELVKANPSLISGTDHHGGTPLIGATANGHPDVAAWLILNGADTEAADSNRTTPLHLAAAQGYKDLVRLLLEHGAKVDAEREDGITPLIEASTKEVAEVLVEHGANVNAKDEDGDTPLIRAEYAKVPDSQKKAWVDLLLAHGARVDLFTLPFLWLRVHALWVTATGGAAIALWLCVFWSRRKNPAPSRIVRFLWWLGVYLAGSSMLAFMGMYWFGFSHNPLVFAIEPLLMPRYLESLLPDSWSYALFVHLPSVVVPWLLFLVPFGVYFLHLVLSLSVKRLQTFCFLLVLLLFLIVLSAFGLADWIANFPRPD